MGWTVVHVCRTGWPVVGGMEAAVHGLARAQAAAGHRVEVVTLQYALDDGRGLPDVDHQGVRYRRLPRLGPRRYPFAWGLARAVAHADLVHVHGLDGLADRLVRARRRPPVGISTHGGYLHSSRHRWLKAAALRTVTRRTLRRADAVWFTSAADRDALAPAGVSGPVVPHGVAVDDLLAVRRRPVPGRWLVIGRVDRHKGLERLFAALPHLDPAVHLEIAGPDARGGTGARLRRALRRAGLDHRVRWRGEVTRAELCALLSEAELAVFPSRHEGFGVAVVEAMAAGCPVAVSDIAAHRALIDPGRTGFAVDFDRPERAARQLAGAAARGSEVSEAARRAARAHGWDRRLEDWLRAYAAVLARPALAGPA